MEDTILGALPLKFAKKDNYFLGFNSINKFPDIKISPFEFIS